MKKQRPAKGEEPNTPYTTSPSTAAVLQKIIVYYSEHLEETSDVNFAFFFQLFECFNRKLVQFRVDWEAQLLCADFMGVIRYFFWFNDEDYSLVFIRSRYVNLQNMEKEAELQSIMSYRTRRIARELRKNRKADEELLLRAENQKKRLSEAIKEYREKRDQLLGEE